MTRIVIECDDELAAHAEEAARREHKSVAEWVKDRMKSDVDRLKKMEECALSNGYPPGWLAPSKSRLPCGGFSATLRLHVTYSYTDRS